MIRILSYINTTAGKVWIERETARFRQIFPHCAATWLDGRAYSTACRDAGVKPAALAVDEELSVVYDSDTTPTQLELARALVAHIREWGSS
jgi:hypothetical protein